MILLNLGNSQVTASSLINSTLLIFSEAKRFSKISHILLSCSIAITFLTFLAISQVKVPIPEPISKTTSFLFKLAKFII